MAFTKYAALEGAQVLDVKGSRERVKTASLDKLSDFEDYRTEDGYLYARIRAISSRVNKNHDGWPSVELAGGTDAFNKAAGIKTGHVVIAADTEAKYGYSTFLYKPIFVDHHNSDPARARGVIVDSKLHVEDHKTAAQLDPYYSSAPDNHMPPTWVELLLEVDAKTFPKLAKAIIEGSRDPNKGIDGFSMGCDVERSKCSHCGNEAISPEQYCEHVRLKGAEFPYTDPRTGRTSSRKSYEDCYGIKFFEISAVFDPADETALLREVRAHTAAENPEEEMRKAEMMADIRDRAERPFREEESGYPYPSGDIACAHCNGEGCDACYGTGQANTYAVQNPGTDGYLTPQRIDNLPFGVANPASPNIEAMDVPPGYPRRQGATEDEWWAVMNPVKNGVYGDWNDIRQKAVERLQEWGELDPETGEPIHGIGSSDINHTVYGLVRSGELQPIPGREHEAYPVPNYPYQRNASTHTAEAPPPQVDELKVPEGVDTLREETICPICGSDMDSETCNVCGYERPPEGFQNPDLTIAEGTKPENNGPEQTAGPNPTLNGSPGATSNNPMTAHVKNDMSWTVSTTHESYTQPSQETPAVPNAGPATDEPKDAVVKTDHTEPVTSHVRTAEDFLAAADATRRTMSQKTADAASGAPEAATPDKNIDVDAVGGIMDASNEQASKADAQIDVEGQGNTGPHDVSADKTETVDQGDEHSKNVEEIHTKTWGNGSGVEKQRDPVGGPVYPAEGGVTSSWQVQALDNDPYPSEDGGLSGGGTNKGTQPADPVGKPDERVDVLDTVTSPENNSGETKTWSGTDGNGVTKQVDPVTNETLEKGDIVNLSPSTSSAHIFAAMELADREVELGLTPKEAKYERAAELEKLSPEALQAEARVVGRVKTAGLSKATKTAMRMPAMGRNASVDKESKEEPQSTFISDSSIFLK